MDSLADSVREPRDPGTEWNGEGKRWSAPMLSGPGWGLQAVGFSCAVSLVALHSERHSSSEVSVCLKKSGSVGAPTGRDKLPEFRGVSLSAPAVGPTKLLMLTEGLGAENALFKPRAKPSNSQEVPSLLPEHSQGSLAGLASVRSPRAEGPSRPMASSLCRRAAPAVAGLPLLGVLPPLGPWKPLDRK